MAQEGKRLVRPAQGVPPKVPQGVRLDMGERSFTIKELWHKKVSEG